MLSLIALIISVGSFAVTLWATRLSKQALDHSVRVQQRGDLKEFEGIRAELLKQLSDSRSVLDKTRIEIGTLRADFESEPSAVQAALENYTGLFSEYLPRVEDSIRQCDNLWTDISCWTKEKGHDELMRARAVLYRSLKDDETVYDSAIYMIKTLKTKLQLAKQHFALTHRT